ncbi:hypothetical protein BGX28_006225 [Mortierella sp. GBA30]|nr:hypothetical protein BGX28_006225 [Mortierella sp. GBA30]
MNRNASTQSLYQQSVTTPDSAVSLSSEASMKEHLLFERHEDHLVVYQSAQDTAISRGTSRGPASLQLSSKSSGSYPLWPTVFGLFTNHTSRAPTRESRSSGSEAAKDICDGTIGSGHYTKHVHELARAKDLSRHAFGTLHLHQLPGEKFPHLHDLYQKASCAILFFKIHMDIGQEAEGTFENTCLFESSERRTVRCSSVIYSFGASVLESMEMKQATFMEGKFVHSFEFVNQFFNAFLSGIRSLGTSDEVEAALSNLSLVQTYEDVDDPRAENASPLLVITYDFERGHSQVTPYFVAESSDMIESIVC